MSMRDYAWMKRLSTIIDQINTLTADIERRMKELDTIAEISNTKKRVASIHNKLTRYEKKAMQEVNPERK